MKSKLSIDIISLLLLFGISAYQLEDDPFAKLIERFESYTQTYAQEKVHLHLDKPYYAIGDDIWFKAYVINTKTNELTDKSKALYVELINEKDSLKKQIKLPLFSGLAWGDFKLNDSLSEGNYRIRAYTQFMRNQGPEFFFDKTIKIANGWANKVFTKTTYHFKTENNTQKIQSTIHFTDKSDAPYQDCDVNYEAILDYRSIAKGKAKTDTAGNVNISFTNPLPSIYKSGKIIATLTLANGKKVVKSIPIKSTSAVVDVQFFPESGNLIENIPSKVAVKSVNASGLGENITGEILDNEGNKYSDFSCEYLGMGNFYFTPQANKTYYAKVKFIDGSEQKFKLPNIQKSGYSLTINNSDTAKVSLKIKLSEDLIGKGEIKVIAQHSGSICYVSKSNTDKQVLNATIPSSKLPSGIIQFTLFSPNNTPIAERLIFINHLSEQIDIKAIGLKENYSTREKVEFNIKTFSFNNPSIGSYSVSVTNASQVPPDIDNETNILTSLLLTSDLAGYIEKPNHYFINNDLKTRQELDNLMLTQGWRRFLWKNIVNGYMPNLAFQPEQSFKISGKVTSNGVPVADAIVSLLSTSGTTLNADTVTNTNGTFSFDNLVFNDSNRFVIHAKTSKNRKNVQLDVDMQGGQIITKNKNAADIEVNVNNTLMHYIKESDNYFKELARLGVLEHSVTLQDVVIVEKKNPAKNSSNLNGPGNADYIVTADKLFGCNTLSQCLQGRIPGVIIQNGIPYSTRSMYSSFSGPIPMEIVVDGMMMGSRYLDNVNPIDVESIEVLRSGSNIAIYGIYGGGGLLIITTKRGESNMNYRRYAPGTVNYTSKGFYKPRQFYSPKYDNPTETTPLDLRTTIYWNPEVITNKEGMAQISFYNADTQGNYRIVIEGINANGNLGRQVYTYYVK